MRNLNAIKNHFLANIESACDHGNEQARNNLVDLVDKYVSLLAEMEEIKRSAEQAQMTADFLKGKTETWKNQALRYSEADDCVMPSDLLEDLIACAFKGGWNPDDSKPLYYLDRIKEYEANE